MNPRVQAVTAVNDHLLQLLFEDGQVRQFDVRPYTALGFFQELQEPTYFSRVAPFLGSIQWPNGQDFCPDTLYEEGEPVAEGEVLVWAQVA